jgi:hypothetical protein
MQQLVSISPILETIDQAHLVVMNEAGATKAAGNHKEEEP